MSAVTTTLAEIRERAEAVSEAVAQLADAAIEANTAQVPEGVARPAILARIASSFDVPSLLAAAEAVLKLADEFDAEDGYNAEAEPDLGRPGSRGDKIRRNVARALLASRQPGQVPPDHPDAGKPVGWGEHSRDCDCGECP